MAEPRQKTAPIANPVFWSQYHVKLLGFKASSQGLNPGRLAYSSVTLDLARV